MITLMSRVSEKLRRSSRELNQEARILKRKCMQMSECKSILDCYFYPYYFPAHLF